MNLLATLRAFFSAQGVERTYWLAYSGGLDSHALLRLCAVLRDELSLSLHAIHINHGLSPHAGEWAKHCATVCAEYGIPYHEYLVQIDRSVGTSLEAEARKERYAAFARCMQAGDMVLTAHHQNDQAETVLLQLLRGAGPKGLAAMPAVKTFASGWLGRPLLDSTRKELEQYAREQSLHWIEDESNQNTTLRRNFIRQEVMPLLTSQWPSAVAALARSANHCAESQVLLEEFSASICNDLGGSQPDTLSVSKLLALPVERQRLVLRSWMHRLGYPLPNQKKLNSILQTVLLAQSDRMPQVCWAEVDIRRYQDDLYIQALLPAHDVGAELTWQVEQPLSLPDGGALNAVRVLGQGLQVAITNVSVRFRQGGEMVALPKRGRHTLKNLFQEWQVAPWLRDRVPLLYIDDQLIAVVGYFLHPDYQAVVGEWGWEIKHLVCRPR